MFKWPVPCFETIIYDYEYMTTPRLGEGCWAFPKIETLGFEGFTTRQSQSKNGTRGNRCEPPNLQNPLGYILGGPLALDLQHLLAVKSADGSTPSKTVGTTLTPEEAYNPFFAPWVCAFVDGYLL